MILSDLQSWPLIVSFFKCDSSNIYAVFDKMSTDMTRASRGSLGDSWVKLLYNHKKGRALVQIFAQFSEQDFINDILAARKWPSTGKYCYTNWKITTYKHWMYLRHSLIE